MRRDGEKRGAARNKVKPPPKRKPSLYEVDKAAFGAGAIFVPSTLVKKPPPAKKPFQGPSQREQEEAFNRRQMDRYEAARKAPISQKARIDSRLLETPTERALRQGTLRKPPEPPSLTDRLLGFRGVRRDDAERAARGLLGASRGVPGALLDLGGTAARGDLARRGGGLAREVAPRLADRGGAVVRGVPGAIRGFGSAATRGEVATEMVEFLHPETAKAIRGQEFSPGWAAVEVGGWITGPFKAVGLVAKGGKAALAGKGVEEIVQAAKAGHRAPLRTAYRAATKDATLQVPERAAAQEVLAKISSTPEEAANYSHTLDVAVRDKVKGLRGPKRQEAIAKEYRAWTEAAKPVKWETESVPGVGRVPIAKAATAAVEEAPSPGVIHMPGQPVPQALDEAAQIYTPKQPIPQAIDEISESLKVHVTPKRSKFTKDPDAFIRAGVTRMASHIEETLQRAPLAPQWYKDSADRIMEISHGNLEEAEKIFQLVGIYSAQNEVIPNIGDALRAYTRYQRGVPLDIHSVKDPKALKVLKGEGTWSGRKTNNFYRDLLAEAWPERYQQMVEQGLVDDVTVDRHMYTLFGLGENDTAYYDYVQDAVRKFADLYGMTPRQMQATAWVAEKARKLMVVDGKSEAEAWAVAKKSFADGIGMQQYTARLPFEARPGDTALLPDYENWSPEVKAAHLTAVLPSVERYFQASKLPFSMRTAGHGYYVAADGTIQVNPAFAVDLHVGYEMSAPKMRARVNEMEAGKRAHLLDDAQRETYDALAIGLGYGLRQEAGSWFRPLLATKKATDTLVHARFGRAITEDELTSLVKAFEGTETWFSHADDGVYVVHGGDIPAEEFRPKAEEILDTLSGERTVDLRWYNNDSNYIGDIDAHYIEARDAGRLGESAAAADRLRQEVDTINAAFRADPEAAAREVAGEAAQAQASGRIATVARRAGARAREALEPQPLGIVHPAFRGRKPKAAKLQPKTAKPAEGQLDFHDMAEAVGPLRARYAELMRQPVKTKLEWDELDRLESSLRGVELRGPSAPPGGGGGLPPPGGPRPTAAAAGGGPPGRTNEEIAQGLYANLRGARIMRGKEDVARRKELATRLERAGEASAEAGGGLAGVRAAKAQLRGELPKLEFNSGLREEEISQLIRYAEESGRLGDERFDPIKLEAAFSRVARGEVPTKSQIALLERVFGPEPVKAVKDDIELWRRGLDWAVEITGFPRAMKSSIDFSAPLRQGLFMMTADPKVWRQAWGPGLKAMRKVNYEQVQREIISRPTYKAMKKGGLAITDVGESLASQEEAYMSSLAERIVPGVGASQRGYTGFLNRLRADAFDTLYHQGIDINPEWADDPVFLKSIGRTVNVLTGRGSLRSHETAAKTASLFLFSPRLIASRVEYLLSAANPVVWAPGLGDPRKRLAREMMRRSLARMVGGAALLLNLANQLPGVEVDGLDQMWEATKERDLGKFIAAGRSADFLKLKIGDTRIDVLGGQQQYLVLASRLVSGEKVDSTTGEVKKMESFGHSRVVDTLWDFFVNKAAPVPAYFIAWDAGMTPTGNEFDPRWQLLRLNTPIGIENWWDTNRDYGPARATAEFIPNVVGFGSATYGEDSRNPPKRKKKSTKSRKSEYGKGWGSGSEYGTGW